MIDDNMVSVFPRPRGAFLTAWWPGSSTMSYLAQYPQDPPYDGTSFVDGTSIRLPQGLWILDFWIILPLASGTPDKANVLDWEFGGAVGTTSDPPGLWSISSNDRPYSLTKTVCCDAGSMTLTPLLHGGPPWANVSMKVIIAGWGV